MIAFWELATERQFSQEGMGPIPWRRIVQFAERSNLDRPMQDVFTAVIRDLDEAYLKQQIDDRQKRRSREERYTDEQKKEQKSERRTR